MKKINLIGLSVLVLIVVSSCSPKYFEYFEENTLCSDLGKNNTGILIKDTKRVILPYDNKAIELNNLFCLIYPEDAYIVCAKR